jgi:hypothetical protein
MLWNGIDPEKSTVMTLKATIPQADNEMFKTAVECGTFQLFGWHNNKWRKVYMGN